jgi:pimeloyl-ACP methyl ester carboxylesterase
MTTFKNLISKALIFNSLFALAMTETNAGGANVGLATAPNQTIEANGIKFSYRNFGKKSGTPIVFLQHFTGTMDAWDPAVIDGLAKTHQVIVFNNTGMGHSSGKVADSIEQMTKDASAFIDALGYKQVDLVGFSMGGFIAQELAAANSEKIRKLVLVGTSNKGGGEHLMKVLGEAFAISDQDPRQYLFFTQTAQSQAAGKEFIKRSSIRKDRDPEISKDDMNAHGKALITWANTPDPEFKLLKSIKQPVLVVQGSNDTMLYTANSITLYQHLPDAQLVLYPDSGHGSLFQYPADFVSKTANFLN